MKPKCSQSDCNNNAMSVGTTRKGKRKYSKLCTKHHKNKYNMLRPGPRQRLMRREGLLEKSREACSRCGWQESYCDRHRLIPGKDGGEYTKENIVVLCPNCHRVEHRKSDYNKVL